MTESISKISEDSLIETAKKYAERSISPNTKRAYETDWKYFVQWCCVMDLESYPASPQTVSNFAADCAKRFHRVNSILRRMTSISVIHRAGGLESPCASEVVKRVIAGIKREHGDRPKRSAKAISWSELCAMVDKCGSSILGVRDAAILILGWTIAARRSEICNLDFDDLEFGEQGMIVTIRKSKTDSEGKGQKIGIPFSGNRHCPVKIIRSWIDRSMTTSGEPLFVPIGAGGSSLWLFKKKMQTDRLSDRMISLIVKRYAKLIGLPPGKYSAHSLRRGFATEAGAAGIPERLIARQTRHSSLAVLRGYIDDGTIFDNHPLTTIYNRSIATADR